MKVTLFAALTATLLPITASAASDAPKRLQTAAAAFKEVMGIPDKAIPQELLEKAECIVIIPDLKKGAFIVGGKYGKGFVSCRKKDGVGWSAPGSVRIEWTEFLEGGRFQNPETIRGLLEKRGIAIDSEIVPFYCRACEASYCETHWTTWPVFDPDWPSWFEELRGVCPLGHERCIHD